MTQRIISVLKSNFPRWKMSSIYQLTLQIYAIDKGWRSGYLWDVPEKLPEIKDLREILKVLLNNRVIRREIDVLSMEMETFLINRESLIESFKDPDSVVFIDIQSPMYVRIDRKEDILRLLQQLKANVDRLDFSSYPRICLASISGLLIGYPVIYYFDPECEFLSSGSELLMVYKVYSSGEYPLYSFSVPVIVLEREKDIRDHMEKWWSKIESSGLRIERKQETITSWVL